MQLKPHTTVLCEKVKVSFSESNTLKTIKFITNNIKFDIIINMNFSTL